MEMKPVEIRAKLRELESQRTDACKLVHEYRAKHRAALHYVQMLEAKMQRLQQLHPTYRPRKKKESDA